MGKVSPMPSTQPDPEVIGRLEEMLAEARAGKVQSIAMVAVTNEREVWCLHGGKLRTPFVVVGALEQLKLEIFKRQVRDG